MGGDEKGKTAEIENAERSKEGFLMYMTHSDT